MKIRKLISALLVLCMVLAWIPAAAWAEETPELTLGEVTTVTIPEEGEAYLSFTPAETGIYQLTSYASSDTVAVLFDAGGNQIGYNDDGGEDMNFALSAVLTAGKTYTYGVAFYSGSSGTMDIQLSFLGAVELQELTLNVPATATITDDLPIAYFTFTPTVSDNYLFAASSNGGDTLCYLYDADWKTITSSDDANGTDFGLEAYLTAGNTYIYAAQYYGNYSVGSFSVLLSVVGEEPEEPEEPEIPEDPDPVQALGDVNNDGFVDIFDANLVVAYFNGTTDFTDAQFVAGDTDYNGAVDIFDANLIVIQYNASHTQIPVIHQVKANKTEVFVGDDALIYFYAEVTGNISSVQLLDATTNTVVAEMLDDGLYSVSGDDLPNDNVYSCKIKLDASVEATHSYIVSATYFESAYSEPIYIQITTGFTYEQLADMESVDLAFQNDLFESAGYEEMSLEERVSLADEVLDSLVDQELIEEDTLLYNEEHGAYTFVYSSGVLGAVILKEWDAEEDGTGSSYEEPAASGEEATEPARAERRDENCTIASYAEQGAVYASGDEVAYIGDAIVLWSFEQAWDDPQMRIPFYQQLESDFDALGLETTVDWDTTVDDYKKLDDYEVIMISGHGGYEAFTVKSGWNSKETKTLPCLLLFENVSKTKDEAYASDLKQFRVGKLHVQGGTMYAILPDFFSHYYSNGDLDGSFVFIQDCCSHGQKGNEDYQFANALLNASAEAVVGYHNSVKSYYGRNFMKTYISHLIDGDTAGEAFSAAISAHGANDGKSVNAAYPLFSGSTDALLLPLGIQNGDFEQGSTPISWTQIGDVRVLTQLGTVSPSSKQRMAILTTGVGSAEEEYLAGTEGSVLSQTFQITEGATTLNFSYDIVSEEPMEYVGSQYNDAFIVKLTVDSEVYILATEDINNSVWYVLGDSYFEAGDDTTYHTMWKTVQFDISAFAGKIVTLEFVVYDVGDSAYDTAALIDNVYLS